MSSRRSITTWRLRKIRKKGCGGLPEAHFDCVLVDFEMPGLDGAEVCRRIRQTHAETEPEIVLIMSTARMTISGT